MSLIVIAIGFEVYQFVAHVHCLSGRTLPDSHRSTRGFGAAILVDALSYLLSSACLYASGGPWTWLLLPLLAHVFYGSLLVFFRSHYVSIHDYRMRTIYADGAFCRSKRIASVFDTSFHLLAVVLLARYAPAPPALFVAAVGVVGYFFVFPPAPLEEPVRRLRSGGAGARVVRDKHA